MLRSLLFALVCAGTPIAAEIPTNLAAAGINPGWRDGDRHIAGLTIKMAKGWHTYWRSPGAVGFPPSFNWSGSQNISGVNVQFPVPEVYQENGSTSLVYFDSVTFPLVLAPRDASQPIQLKGEIEIGVCEEICIPVTLRVDATLKADGNRDANLAAAMKSKPETGDALSCDIAPISDGLRMTATAAMAKPNGPVFAVIETKDPRVWVSPPNLSWAGQALIAEVDMVPPNAKPFALARSEVRMTVFSGDRVIEMSGCR